MFRPELSLGLFFSPFKGRRGYIPDYFIYKKNYLSKNFTYKRNYITDYFDFIFISCLVVNVSHVTLCHPNTM
jgi:hypothetical protein